MKKKLMFFFFLRKSQAQEGGRGWVILIRQERFVFHLLAGGLKLQHYIWVDTQHVFFLLFIFPLMKFFILGWFRGFNLVVRSLNKTLIFRSECSSTL